MKTDMITVSSRGSRMEKALEQVEKVAAYLDCSVNQVYQAKKRCFAMMREILLKMNEQDPELKLELSRYGI